MSDLADRPDPTGAPGSDVPGGSRRRDRGAHPDRSPWNWLLLVPLLVTLYPPIYNRLDPHLGGFPFFYWYQLAVIAVGVLCTLVVYLKTRR